jgi:hypothetical protein
MDLAPIGEQNEAMEKRKGKKTAWTPSGPETPRFPRSFPRLNTKTLFCWFVMKCIALSLLKKAEYVNIHAKRQQEADDRVLSC